MSDEQRPGGGPAEEAGTGGGGHGGASGRWLVSYADFITLMMVVFMVLYSMARVDGEKYGKLKASLAGSSIGTPATPLPVGGNPTNTAPTNPGPDPNSHPGQPAPTDPVTATPAPPVVAPPTPAPDVLVPPVTEPKAPEPKAPPSSATQPAPAPTPAPAPKPAPDAMGSLRTGLASTSAARAGNLSVELQDRGVVVSVLTSVLFNPGQAVLKPEGAAILSQISAQLTGTSESILVEGAPDSASADAPWDLASRRAGAVVSYLVNTHGLAGDRFAVIGYGKGAGVDGIVNVVVLRRKP